MKKDGVDGGRGWIFNLQVPVPLRADISLIAPPRTAIEASSFQTVNKWPAKRHPKSTPPPLISIFFLLNCWDNFFNTAPLIPRHILVLAVNWPRKRSRNREVKREKKEETGRTASRNADCAWYVQMTIAGMRESLVTVPSRTVESENLRGR